MFVAAAAKRSSRTIVMVCPLWMMCDVCDPKQEVGTRAVRTSSIFITGLRSFLSCR